MRSCSGLLSLASAAGLLLAPGPAAAQGAPPVRIDVMVSYISSQPGSVDPRAQRLHEQLRRDLAYKSLRVLQMQRMLLNLDERRGLKLPNGRQLWIRPILVDERGILAAIEVGDYRSDQRLYKRRLWVYGGERYLDGKLVISLEPD